MSSTIHEFFQRACWGGGAWLAHALELNYRFDAMLWVAGVVAATLLLGAAGALSTRSMVNVPPRAVLY